MKEHALLAKFDPAERADQRKWYLPFAGQESVEYESWDEARRASTRLSPILGLPEVDPISIKEWS